LHAGQCFAALKRFDGLARGMRPGGTERIRINPAFAQALEFLIPLAFLIIQSCDEIIGHSVSKTDGGRMTND